MATPGLGSLMGRRYLEGAGQLCLALIGAGLVIGWSLGLMAQTYQAIVDETQPSSIGWIGRLGAIIFAIAWLWSLVTSLSLLRQARANQAKPQPPKLS